MIAASFIFSSPEWFWPALAALGVGALILWWTYRQSIATPAIRLTCAGLKFFGVAILALCLLEPLWSGKRAKPGANLFAVVADTSQGLKVKDQGATQSRAELLAAMLKDEPTGWQASLEENFDLRRFVFDARLQSARDFQDLQFDGQATALGSALKGIRDRFEGRPLAGVLLFTDGNATDLKGALPDVTGLPPVYPVVLGEKSDITDAAIAHVNITQSAFEDAPVTVQADVSTAGLRGKEVIARLVDPSGKTVQSATLRARKDEDTLPFRFQFRPEKPGISFYRLETQLRDEPEARPETETKEATLLNNNRVLAIDRGKGSFRVLYVAGRPNWEFKFLNRALQEDREVQLVGLICIARREPKFDFRGRGGETSNPLFRGFGNQAREETERYDQPVLVRLNTRDDMELRGGFPITPEELYSYDAVVLDDVEAAFFTTDQQMLLQRFVSERGGGLLMLGGMESFQEGSYDRTPVGEMLPMYLGKPGEMTPPGPVRLDLTREGWLQPWVRLRTTEAEEKTRLQEMPPFLVLNPVKNLKPGASVLATATDETGKEHPALLTQRFGRGRTGAFAVGDFWRWGMASPVARTDMEKAWRQVVRWLVADVPGQVEVVVEPANDGDGRMVNLLVRARGPKFEPLDDATVFLQVQPATAPGTNPPAKPILIRAEPSSKEPGVFEATYVAREPGGYLAQAAVTNAAGLQIGRAEAGWSIDLAQEEFRSLQPNTALLEDLARRTGGQVLSKSDLDSFARRLPNRTAPVMEPVTKPLWHTPWVFGLALACFAAEWGLRRWKGLP